MNKMTLSRGLLAGFLTTTALLMSGCVTVEAPNQAPVADIEALPPANEESDVTDTQRNEPSEMSSTQGWQTYTNTDYDYSIKYPPTWTVDLRAKDSRGNAIATFLDPGQNNSPREIIVDIQVTPTVNVSLIDGDISTVVVGGKRAQKITSLNNGNTVVYVEMGKDSDTYILALRNTTSSDTEYIDTFDLMLSSFTFTN